MIKKHNEEILEFSNRILDERNIITYGEFTKELKVKLQTLEDMLGDVNQRLKVLKADHEKIKAENASSVNLEKAKLHSKAGNIRKNTKEKQIIVNRGNELFRQYLDIQPKEWIDKSDNEGLIQELRKLQNETKKLSKRLKLMEKKASAYKTYISQILEGNRNT